VADHPFTFYLGTHRPAWLGVAPFPLCISRRQLAKRAAQHRGLPRAQHRWLLDSGGFSELTLFGEWRTSTSEYIAEVRHYSQAVGRLELAAPQDWMCEPGMLAKTGKSVAEHQSLTVQNYLELKSRAPELPWFPVLQGWWPADYLRHIEAYSRAGVELADERVVGLGSVCRRQGTLLIAQIVEGLCELGLRLHGFGFKVSGLRRAWKSLRSADCAAWSAEAGRKPPLPGHSHKHCNNCYDYAGLWRARILSELQL